MKTHSSKIRGNLSLLAVAIIFGSGYIGTKISLDAQLGPALIGAARFLVASAVLGLVLLFIKKTPTSYEWKSGIAAGIFCWFGSYMLALAQQTTIVSTCALFAAIYVVFIPLLLWGIDKNRPPVKVFIAALLCFGGAGILNLDGLTITFGIGEFLALVSALGYSGQIIVMGKQKESTDVFAFTFCQLLTVMVLYLIAFLITENNTLRNVNWSVSIPTIIYLGIFPSALCLLLQAYGQQRVSASVSGLFMSLESVAASIFSILLGFEVFTTNLLIGGIVIILAVALVTITPQESHELE